MQWSAGQMQNNNFSPFTLRLTISGSASNSVHKVCHYYLYCIDSVQYPHRRGFYETNVTPSNLPTSPHLHQQASFRTLVQRRQSGMAHAPQTYSNSRCRHQNSYICKRRGGYSLPTIIVPERSAMYTILNGRNRLMQTLTKCTT